ncbi:MAG: hypothetical protein JXB48_13170 [Candidatus Latescibacteria bacterium]|nr:hypothetical protein [Candidatus Latescibacterota bacterium]
MDCLLGIDIGTAGTKSILFTTNGDYVDTDYIPYSITYPSEGLAEQNPEDWWLALVTTVKNILSRNNGANVLAMSLSTQGGCTLLLDESFRPICNAVSWLDSRAKETSGLMRTQIGEDELYRACGWPGINGMNFATILWFKEKMPAIYNRTQFFASTVDYLNYRLTGVFTIDYSNLAMTSFLDLKKRDWSDKALAIAGLSRSKVSRIIPSGKVLGTLNAQAANELGLPRDVSVVSGAHDQYCASIGAGAIENGDCVLSTGTAWVLTVTSDTMLFNDSRTIHPCIHVLENKYGLLTTVPSGGNSLNWFQHTFRPDADFETLNSAAESVYPGCDNLQFIPQKVSGNNSGLFANIDNSHSFNHFARSVFEGVALANRRHLDAFSKSGISVSKVIMIGGGAKSFVWPQIVADVSNVPVIIPDQREASCTGAAMLAGVGSGTYPSIETAVTRFIGGNKTICQPNERNVAVYAKKYREFSAILDNTVLHQ